MGFVTSAMVANCVLDTLKKWLPTYLRVVADDTGSGLPVVPKEFRVATASLASLSVRQYPLLSVWVNGVRLESAGDGRSAAFSVTVNVTHKGSDWAGVTAASGVYETAIGALLEHRVVEDSPWVDVVLVDGFEHVSIPEEQARTLGELEVSCTVFVRGLWSDVSNVPVLSPDVGFGSHEFFENIVTDITTS